MPQPRVTDALRQGTALLKAAGIDTPALDARLLLAHAASLDQAALLRDRDAALPPQIAARFAAHLARRAAREPLAYITGRQGFWTLDLEVSPDTLIPRPDSETIVEAALAAQPSPARVLDLGTGTGCLLLAVLSERPGAWGLGTDRAPGAAALAARNARRCDLAARTAFLVADWAAPLHATFDLVLGNPPYIAAPDLPALMPEVAVHEPRLALDGGPDGLDAYRAILAALPRLLATGGTAVLELGQGQSGPVSALAHQAGFTAAPHHDLNGIPRALVLQRPSYGKGLGTGRSAH